MSDARASRARGGPQPTNNAVLRVWYELTAPPPAPSSTALAVREANRRGRIASLIIGGTLVGIALTVINVPFATANVWSLSLAMAGCVAAIFLNRAGYLAATGWALVVALDAALVLPLVAVWGMLDPIYLPAYYLLIVPALIAVSLLRPSTVFLVAGANSLFIALDIRFEPHNMMWDQMVTSSSELYSLLIGPVALQIIVALLAYLWVRSSDTALRRADRAEEIARLERAGAEQRRLLAEGIQQILQTHVRFANGDLSTRAPASQDSMLWQVSVALNNLLARFQRLAQEDGFSRASTEQVAQARVALRQWQAGRESVWPQPAGLALDPLLADLRTIFSSLPAPSAMGSAFSAPEAPSVPARGGFTGAPSVLARGGFTGAPASQPYEQAYPPMAPSGMLPYPDLPAGPGGPSQPLHTAYDPYQTGVRPIPPQPDPRVRAQPPAEQPWQSDAPRRYTGG